MTTQTENELVERVAKAMWNDGDEVKEGLVPPWEKLTPDERAEWETHSRVAIEEIRKG